MAQRIKLSTKSSNKEAKSDISIASTSNVIPLEKENDHVDQGLSHSKIDELEVT